MGKHGSGKRAGRAARAAGPSALAGCCLAWALAGAGAAVAQPVPDTSASRQDLMCNRPASDCAGSGLARQRALIQSETQPDVLDVRPADGAQGAGAPVSMRLKSVRFTGATALDTARLNALAQPYLDRDVGLSQLEALAQDVAGAYRREGYFLAQALVPAQTIRNGEVEISVIEGRLGRIMMSVAEDAPVSETRIRAFLAALENGKPLHEAEYERVMLLISDLPGIQVRSGLQSGAAPGTTDLVVEVQADRRVLFAIDGDNHGVRETGRLRLGATVRVASPLGIGDNLDFRGIISKDNGLNYGRLSWEAPIGASGLRGGLGVGRTGYELDGEFAVLGAKGVAEVADVSFSYPVIRQRNQNLFLRLGADVKHLRDDLNALDYSARKRTAGVSLGWSWERRDGFAGGGYWASSGTLYHGRLKLRDELSAALDGAPGGRNTEGSFTKLGWQVSRLQTILPRHFLYLSVSGQFASKNLDASEQFSLGGPRAVRAYASGELLVDQGLVATAEWRWAATDELTPFLFFDAAKGRRSRHPTPYEERGWQSLRGAGVGLVWSRPRDVFVTATLAWRVNSRAGVTDGGDRNPRLYVQLQKVF